jgi:Flp pilus assembly protein TadG
MRRQTSTRARSRPANLAGRYREEVAPRSRREAKVLVLMAILLPVLCGMVGLVVDSSLLMSSYRNLQQVSDAAATAAAMALSNGATTADAAAQAVTCVNTTNGLTNANVTVNIPPSSGPYAGNSSYAEVLVSRTQSTDFIQVLGASSQQSVSVRSVAGVQPSTAGAAIVVLDPNPLGPFVNLSPYASV